MYRSTRLSRFGLVVPRVTLPTGLLTATITNYGKKQSVAPQRQSKLDPMTAKYTLILLRHGNSDWNQKNLFTGWVDVDLSDQGRAEAHRAGELLAESGLQPDLLYTSRLKRAINTAHIALNAAERSWIDVKRDWRLNERHYGALQGKDKAQTLAEYGPEMFQTWRRSFDVPPPPIDDNDQYSQAHDERYADLNGNVPKTECLKDVLERMLPFWLSDIQPDLKSGKTVLVTAHGNSLRALVKHLDGVSDEDIAELNIPTGIPLVYKLDENFKPVVAGGEYLDPEAAAAGAAAVAAQGA
jgi:2,3-bisphosphoglycerate-dependent phosphoglycerate mutase